MKNETTPADRNKEPILAILKEIFLKDALNVFEVGSGDCTHAIHFSSNFKNIKWMTSEVLSKHASMIIKITEANLPNIKGPLEFEVGKTDFPKYSYDIVYTANTFHIMNWKLCKSLMKTLGTRLREGAQVIIYGPFNYDGKFTSESNSLFDQSLKKLNPEMGIRSFEDINNAMKKNGFTLYKDYEMPANNRLLVFTRLTYMK